MGSNQHLLEKVSHPRKRISVRDLFEQGSTRRDNRIFGSDGMQDIAMAPREKAAKRSQPLQFGKATLDRCEMLRLKSEFDYVRRHGRKHIGSRMLLVVAPTPDDALRFGIICGKKYSKKAVLRNRARRLLKESFRLLKNRVKPVHCLLIARMAMKGAGLRDVQKEMLWLLDKAGIWKTEEA